MAKLPALDPAAVPEKRGSIYPEPFRSRMGDRAKRRLGDACGLTRFGVNLVTLGPGGQSALRHWHTLEDEFVYVLTGEVVLVTNDGEQTLGPGCAPGIPAARRTRTTSSTASAAPATYLEIGNRAEGDNAFYPDDDLMWVRGRERRLRRAQGRQAILSLATRPRRCIPRAAARIFAAAAAWAATSRRVDAMAEFPAPNAGAAAGRSRRSRRVCSRTRCSAPPRSSRSCRPGFRSSRR